MLKESTNGQFDFRECFFTNRYMGVRKVLLDENGQEPKGSQSGPNPGRKHKPYREMCLNILDRTLAAVKPSMIITLGAPAASTLGHGRKHWKKRGICDVVIRGHRAKLVCLTHTGVAKSLYDRNVESVEYWAADGALYTGVEAEMALMRDAWVEYKRETAVLVARSKTVL